MDYQQTIDFLYSKLPMFQRLGAAALKFDLKNITRLMEALENPHTKIKTIHIAGTNGKGSSAHMVASILQEAGYKTGLFTSPHLKSFTERMRINGQEIPQQEVIEFVDQVSGLIDTLKPSFFELTFAMAMQFFAQQQVDIAVVEVGMGGRLDSTNIITPEVCLITNISLDHQQFLGDTLSEIAAEKAGIIKPGVPVIISENQGEIAKVFIAKAMATGSELLFADDNLRLEQATETRFNMIQGMDILLEGIIPDLKGTYQYKNIVGVVALLLLLRRDNKFEITDDAIQKGLENVGKNTGLKGRWQLLSQKPTIIADTGHNQAGIEQVVTGLEQMVYEKLHIVWGMVDDKNAMELMSFLPKEATYYFVKADLPRALSRSGLEETATKLGLKGTTYLSVMAGFDSARHNADNDDLIFIGGSTFVVAEIENL